MKKGWTEVALGEVLAQDQGYLTSLEPISYRKLSVGKSVGSRRGKERMGTRGSASLPGVRGSAPPPPVEKWDAQERRPYLVKWDAQARSLSG